MKTIDAEKGILISVLYMLAIGLLLRPFHKYRSKNNFLFLADSFALTLRQKNLSVAPLCYDFPSLIEVKTTYPKRGTYSFTDT